MFPITAQEIIQRQREYDWHIEPLRQTYERAYAPLIQQIFWLTIISMLQSLEPECWDI